ncbi:MAG: histidine phosphatase family protein [Chloroflexi bacterium]|nr:histidine phosphatase family protein [Chloroflexota bacterium]
MPRTLLILRHAKSRWDDVGVSDHDRKLTKRGKRDARRLGIALAERGLVPDVILTSTAKRAQSTARRVAKGSGYDGELLQEPSLYSDDEWASLGLLAGLGMDIETAMVVGHNPTLQDLVALLTGEHLPLATANLVCIELPIDDWHQLVRDRPRGRVRFVLDPRELADQPPDRP